MNLFRSFTLFAFFSCVGSLLFAEPFVAIRSSLEPKECYIGDPLTFQLDVTVSSDVMQAPLQIEKSIGEFEVVLNSSPTVTVGRDGKISSQYQFVLMVFSTGNVVFPSIDLHFSTVEGQVSNGKTEPVTVHVKSLLEEKGDEGNLRPLKGLYNFKSYFWIWITLLIVALLVGGYFLWVWITGRKLLDQFSAPPAPPRPPEEVAWEAIHALEDANLIQQGQAKEFYFRLSLIFREYLEKRYGFSALDRTTSELLAEFRRQNFPLTESSLARSFFENADLVKFAKFTPNESEIINDLNQVKQFINVTTPKKVEKDEEKVSL